MLIPSCLVALLSGACERGNPAEGSSTAAVQQRDAAALVGKPQSQTIMMAAGPSTAHFAITAIAPPQHTWDVHVDAPTRADLAVRIRTWYGQRLRVLGTTRDRTSCEIRDRRSVCSMAFPRLEAQRSGKWTVIVVKRSLPPARVRVAVTFNEE